MLPDDVCVAALVPMHLQIQLDHFKQHHSKICQPKGQGLRRPYGMGIGIKLSPYRRCFCIIVAMIDLPTVSDKI